jgi:peptidoglycan/LPS O-acetylase OafA/YrhL
MKMPEHGTIVMEQPEVAPAGRSLSSGEAALRLSFLDGIRALAALYVVLSHQVLDVHESLGRALRVATFPFQYGHYAVDVFIVLSGYCLMLPVARSGRDHLRGGTKEYIQARALRILPPYYAALILSALVLAIVGRASDVKLVDLIAHLLVIHNFNSHWVWSINPPLWSVAVEWQIYFALPLLLLPLRRRLGSLAMVGIAWVIGMAPHLLLPTSMNLDWSFPWYLGLFAMGIWAAEKSFGRDTGKVAMNGQLAAWCCMAGYVIVVIATVQGGWFYRHPYAIDFVMGFATATGLAWAGRSLQETGPLPMVVRMLSNRWLVALGIMSFSLYLVHLPLWWLVDYFIARHLALAPTADFAFRIVVGTPLAILFGLLFYLAVEKPSMTLRARAMSSRRAMKAIPDAGQLSPQVG